MLKRINCAVRVQCHGTETRFIRLLGEDTAKQIKDVCWPTASDDEFIFGHISQGSFLFRRKRRRLAYHLPLP
jgi:hypothetical protein